MRMYIHILWYWYMFAHRYAQHVYADIAADCVCAIENAQNIP